MNRSLTHSDNCARCIEAFCKSKHSRIKPKAILFIRQRRTSTEDISQIRTKYFCNSKLNCSNSRQNSSVLSYLIKQLLLHISSCYITLRKMHNSWTLKLIKKYFIKLNSLTVFYKNKTSPIVELLVCLKVALFIF